MWGRAIRILVLGLVVPGLSLVAAGPGASAEAGTFDVRLLVGGDARLGIGKLPVFPYDGRAGLGEGSALEIAPGVYSVRIPADGVEIPPLEMVALFPALPLEVEIRPHDLVGELDVCTGAMSLDFDAEFVPRMGSIRMTPMSVVTPLTTGSITVAGRSVEGEPLDALGYGRIAGIAEVPKTGNVLVDGILGLPAPATAELPVHLHMAGGFPTCPSGGSPTDTGYMEVRPSSRLRIGRGFPWFPYDGLGSGGDLVFTPTGPGTYDVAIPLSSLNVPPLLMVPPFTFARVEITPNEMRGTFDACAGSVELGFDARFQPVFGTHRSSSMTVVTQLTTGTSTGSFTTISGSPRNSWGDLRLVGVAQVPRTGDLFVDLLLGLPTDAVTDMAVHIDVPDGVLCPG